jgi:ABC-type multidrug transport system fused ATPase/permease subunit
MIWRVRMAHIKAESRMQRNVTFVQKLQALLEPDQIRTGVLLIVLMLFGMVLEMLGVGLVLPVLAIVTDPNALARFPVLFSVFGFFGVGTATQLVLSVMLALTMVYGVKAVFLAYLSWYQSSFVFSIESRLSRRLFAGYLTQPYAFHLDSNSSLMIRNAMTSVGLFSGVIVAAATLVSEVFVLIGIAALLVFAEPVGVMLVGGVLVVAGYSFYRITKTRVSRWGEARHIHEGLRLKCIQEGLGGVRDVKVLGREAQFVANYDKHNEANAAVGKRQAFVSALPRLWLEFLAVAGISALVILMLREGKPPEAMVPTLGLFAAAAFRLMPSANKILVALQNLRYHLPVVDTLYREREILNPSLVPPEIKLAGLRFNNSLVIDHVDYAYSGASKVVLSDICLCIKKGTSVGFVGPSGAGKSTLINILLGLLVPTRGSILVDGQDIHADIRSWQCQIGYVPQSVFLMDDSLRRNIAFGLADDQIDHEAVDRAVRAAQLSSFLKSLPEGLDTQVGERGIRLSGGQCQRIGIARALYHNPSILILDEASSSLDTETEEAVMSAVNQLRNDKTIIIIAHRLTTVSQCDDLYELADGVLRKAQIYMADGQVKYNSSMQGE